MKSTVYDKLNDGTPVLIRLVQPEDRLKLEQGFTRLSPQSKRYRFAVPQSRLRPDQLTYLTEIDNINHVAFGVLDLSRADRPGVAIARYVRLKDDPACAEIAVTVIDEYQHKGLGTKLIDVLAQAARGFDITRFCAYVISENISMIQLLKRFGATFIRESPNLLRADFPVNIHTPLHA